jgi:hypothetical protein
MVTFEEAGVLLLEGKAFVMFWLIPDVSDDGFRGALADGERAVAGLPMKSRECGACGFEPFGGTRFQTFDDAGDGTCAGEPEKNVDVVGDAAYLRISRTTLPCTSVSLKSRP